MGTTPALRTEMLTMRTPPCMQPAPLTEGTAPPCRCTMVSVHSESTIPAAEQNFFSTSAPPPPRKPTVPFLPQITVLPSYARKFVVTQVAEFLWNKWETEAQNSLPLPKDCLQSRERQADFPAPHQHHTRNAHGFGRRSCLLEQLQVRCWAPPVTHTGFLLPATSSHWDPHCCGANPYSPVLNATRMICPQAQPWATATNTSPACSEGSSHMPSGNEMPVTYKGFWCLQLSKYQW